MAITTLGETAAGQVRENAQRGERVLLRYIRIGDIAPGLQLRRFREIVAGGMTITVGAPAVVTIETEPGLWNLAGGGTLDMRVEPGIPYPDDALLLVGEIDQSEADTILGNDAPNRARRAAARDPDEGPVADLPDDSRRRS